ncbi:polyprenyl synthetase family protein [Xylanibacillus composti]|uniref:Geranylgeranyl pyrophosphate synthase n=1 Tax=Xylanibacillus composti TaxID=1572762 RepID=A0A8J4H6L7_9BACL|nr:polyprenyl synthetase family protein [Xylanibacillus composti]MDT9726642.1 polyprenyl synthetase family protein [Xylanibacillus composti]GIQ70796.1 hypothetical protein XYCOK13_36200 [Xylanibacillus composti]
MNPELELGNKADAAYRQAERKAAEYFAVLQEQLGQKKFASVLTGDFQLWKQQHMRGWPWHAWRAKKRKQAAAADGYGYIHWLDHTGKLDEYLDRSIAYVYMRDLGKPIEELETQARIQRAAASLKRYLLKDAPTSRGGQPEWISAAGLYRWGQQEGVETAVIWVLDKLRNVSAHLPKELDAEQAQRKLIKIVVGVVLHVMEELDKEGSPAAERASRLDEAIRLGYAYGLTYPFIDDLLDSAALSAEEKSCYSRMIRTALLTRTVPKLGEWPGNTLDGFAFIHAELREAFEYVKSRQVPESADAFFGQAYVFFHAQELDRAKDAANPSYTNEQIYLPIILKSASSRLIARTITGAPIDEDFNRRTFFYGIYNQLADDFADMFDDERAGAVTPYTYYMRYRDQRQDLINPFELYWTVVAYLIHHVYSSDAKAREVILDRAINGLKRCRERVGKEKYQWIMDTFAAGSPSFAALIQRLVQKADNVDFFDKRLRDQLLDMLRAEREEREAFFKMIRTVRQQINDTLPIAKAEDMSAVKAKLVDAANYSLEGAGKRLRPILSWAMGVQEYGLEASALMPLLRSLEYMHTASLIFDDLPTQDNASTRRGRPTLHEWHDSATAELAGLFLIQRAIREQASLEQFEASSVLAVIRYAARTAEELCTGQAMDLASKGKMLTLEQLNRLCFYKTGIAFEAALVMPAMLAQVPEPEISRLKTFAYHAGIAFQIKDDLLDAEGDGDVLGKPVGQDAANNNATFVSILGQEEARKQLWEHYCLAMETLQAMERQPVFLKHLLHYIVSRDR